MPGQPSEHDVLGHRSPVVYESCAMCVARPVPLRVPSHPMAMGFDRWEVDLILRF